MSVYVDNIIMSALTFPFLAAIITLPYMIYQYRKFGSIPWFRTLVIYSFTFYLLCAYFLVVLPLPADRTSFVSYAATPQFIPFNFVQEFLAGTSFVWNDPTTWLATLKDPYIYEAIFNVALLVPLGFYLRYYFRRPWWQCLLIGFSTTLFFEVSQITGLFGLYAHPYRLFDVDDLLMNTLGTMVGFWIAGPIRRALPDIRTINEEAREAGLHASFTRRALSFSADLVLAGAVVAAILALAMGAGWTLDYADTNAFITLIATGSLAIFFALIPVITHGQTLGQKMVRLIMVRANAAPAAWYQYLARYGLLYLIIFVPIGIFNWISGLSSEGTGESVALIAWAANHQEALLALWVASLALWALSLGIRIVRSAMGHPLVMLNGLLSNTRVMTLTGVANQRDRNTILDVDQVATLEQLLVQDGTSLAELMKRAGYSVADAVIKQHPDPVKVVVLCGGGNNGGDGWVAAGRLAAKGYPVTILSPYLAEQITTEPARTAALEIFGSAAVQHLPLNAIILPDVDQLSEHLSKATVVIDALLGTGFSGITLREPYATWVEVTNEHHARVPETTVIAIDVPSGLNAQTGKRALPCIVADMTVTLLAYKPGLVAVSTASTCGKISLAKLADISPYLARLKRSGDSEEE